MFSPQTHTRQTVPGDLGGRRRELVPSVRPEAPPLLRNSPSAPQTRDAPADSRFPAEPPGLELRPHRRGHRAARMPEAQPRPEVSEQVRAEQLV